MSSAPKDEGDPDDGVAERMADAVMYLVAVARSAGFVTISEDLLSIREKLQDRAKAGGSQRKIVRGQ